MHKGALATALLIGLAATVARAASCPSYLDGTQLWRSPNITLTTSKGSPLIGISIVFPDTSPSSRQVLNISFVRQTNGSQVTNIWPTAQDTPVAACEQRFTLWETWAGLVGHSGEAQSADASHVYLTFGVRAQWLETVLFSDNESTSKREVTAHLAFRLRAQRTLSLSTGGVLLEDSSLLWALLLRSEYDADALAITVAIETRVANSSRAGVGSVSLGAAAQFSAAACAEQPAAAAYLADGRLSQRFVCTLSFAAGSAACSLAAGDNFTIAFNISAASGAVAPATRLVAVDLSGSENWCDYTGVPDQGAQGSIALYADPAYSQAATRFSLGDTVYVLCRFQTAAGDPVASASLVSAEIAGLALKDSSLYALLCDNGTATSAAARYGFADGLQPVPSSNYSFSFALNASLFNDEGDLIVAASFATVLSNARRADSASALSLKLSARADLAPRGASAAAASASERVLYAVLGTMCALIACSLAAIAVVALYRRRSAAPARPPRAYLQLAGNI